MNLKSIAVIGAKLLCTGALSAIALAPLSALAQSYTGGTGGDIPDGTGANISSTINVSDNFVLTGFTSVTITGLNHVYLGNLIVTLSHDGQTVDIFDRVRGDGSAAFGDDSNLSGNYTFVTTGGADFNTAAAAGGTDYVVPSNVSYATVPVGNTFPFNGVSSANGLLSDFAGLNAIGAWTLNISDRVGGVTRDFNGSRLFMNGGTATSLRAEDTA